MWGTGRRGGEGGRGGQNGKNKQTSNKREEITRSLEMQAFAHFLSFQVSFVFAWGLLQIILSTPAAFHCAYFIPSSTSVNNRHASHIISSLIPSTPATGHTVSQRNPGQNKLQPISNQCQEIEWCMSLQTDL